MKTAGGSTTKPAGAESVGLTDELVQISSENTLNEEARRQPQPGGIGQSRRRNLHFDHKPSAKMDVLIHAINNSDIGWKADICKLSNAPKNCHENKITNLAQVSDASEARAFGEGPEFNAVKEKVQKYQKLFKSADEIPDTELPAQFDWRNVDGYDFTGKVRDQKGCGSCYTLGFTQAVESRMKVKYGQEGPAISAQMLLSCNYLNEGCEGGLPNFAAMFAENAYLVSEECAPYKANTKYQPCSSFSACKPEARISRSYDIGDGYGMASEKAMMKEILRNGALNTEFLVPKIFQSYSEGILSEKGIDILQKSIEEEKGKSSLAQGVSGESLADRGKEFEKVNHSILLTGWGQNAFNGEKYWFARNSYGTHWGQHGDFLVKRGSDDFGIESQAVGFEVETME